MPWRFRGAQRRPEGSSYAGPPKGPKGPPKGAEPRPSGQALQRVPAQLSRGLLPTRLLRENRLIHGSSLEPLEPLEPLRPLRFWGLVWALAHLWGASKDRHTPGRHLVLLVCYASLLPVRSRSAVATVGCPYFFLLAAPPPPLPLSRSTSSSHIWTFHHASRISTSTSTCISLLAAACAGLYKLASSFLLARLVSFRIRQGTLARPGQCEQSAVSRSNTARKLHPLLPRGRPRLGLTRPASSANLSPNRSSLVT